MNHEISYKSCGVEPQLICMSEPEFGAGPDVTWDKEEEIGT